MIENVVVKKVNRALPSGKYFEQTIVKVTMRTEVGGLKPMYQLLMDKVDLDDLIENGILSSDGVIDFDELTNLIDYGNVEVLDSKIE